MANLLIFDALVPTPEPQTVLGQVLDSLGNRRRTMQQECIIVPTEDNETHGYFRATCVQYCVELAEVQPGTVLPSDAIVLVIMYNAPYNVILGDKRVYKTAEGSYEVSTPWYPAVLTVKRGFSTVAMSELLNRWVCACDVGNVSDSAFANVFNKPSVRAFVRYKPDPARDGITFVIRDSFSAS